VINNSNEKPAWTFAVEYDGGDKSCGDLILDLHNAEAPPFYLIEETIVFLSTDGV
jgi:hypothetical protein